MGADPPCRAEDPFMAFSSRLRLLSVTVLTLVATGLGSCGPRQQIVTLSSGSGNSAYARIGDQIRQSAQRVNMQVEDWGDSQGSKQNLERLLAGEVDFAIVQLDVASAAMREGDVAAVAMLTQEYFHIIVHQQENLSHINDLDGLPVNIGPTGSGINFTATRLFNAADIKVQPELEPALSTGLELFVEPDSPLQALIYVGPLSTSEEVRRKLVDSDGLDLMPLDESFINYLTLQFPESYRRAYIPEGTYRPLPPFPSQDVLTISTGGALLTRPDVSREKVALMTWAILSHARQFASFYPQLAGENGAVNLYEGLLYVSPAAMRTYHEGDPRVAWLRYLEENKPLQAASIMLISTTTIGFLLGRWRKRKMQKFLAGHRQAIAELQGKMQESPQEALRQVESLQQGYRLMLIEGNLAAELYQQIDHMNRIFIDQCRAQINSQQTAELNQIIDSLAAMEQQEGRKQPLLMEHLQESQHTYREMLLHGHLDLPTYLSLYQIRLILDILTASESQQKPTVTLR